MKIAISSVRAQSAMHMLSRLQQYFIEQLQHIEDGQVQKINEIHWLRDGGTHGGGMRVEFSESCFFNRASLNVSQVHYDDQPHKHFSSASALSIIIHPQHPTMPSMHMHISWTEMKNGFASWRVMADLNPSIVDQVDKKTFDETVKSVAGQYYQQGKELGDKYFSIPALQCTRGVSHFYLEQFIAEDTQQENFPENFGRAVINCYCQILRNKQLDLKTPTQAQLNVQLDYHTLYFYQVLTLDKGTTTGLLIHNQNDLGILASLPAKINRGLLAQWAEKTNPPQDKLIKRILSVLGNSDICVINAQVKEAIAGQLRAHYKAHPLHNKKAT